MSAKKLGFVGLGIMGSPMAGHLIKGGHHVYVATRSQVPEDLIKAGAIACKTPAEVAKQADIIFTMVPDTPDVEKVLFGENGIASGKTIFPLNGKKFLPQTKQLVKNILQMLV